MTKIEVNTLTTGKRSVNELTQALFDGEQRSDYGKAAQVEVISPRSGGQ